MRSNACHALIIKKIMGSCPSSSAIKVKVFMDIWYAPSPISQPFWTWSTFIMRIAWPFHQKFSPNIFQPMRLYNLEDLWVSRYGYVNFFKKWLYGIYYLSVGNVMIYGSLERRSNMRFWGYFAFRRLFLAFEKSHCNYLICGGGWSKEFLRHMSYNKLGF